MNTLVFVGLLGIFSYFNLKAAKNFRGSSLMVKSILLFSGAIGYWSFYAYLIWAFFLFAWWYPIVVLVITSILGGILDVLLARSPIGMLLSMIACPIFWMLGLLSLLNVI